MELGFDGQHGAYQPHIVQGPAVSPPPPTADPVGTSAAPSSPPVCGPPATPGSSRAATRRGKKHNILIQGLKTLISMCRSNDTLIRESH
jgi:hypothetical protein